MTIDLSNLFSGIGVVSGNTQSNNQYEFYKGIVWNDTTTTNNQYQFFKKLQSNGGYRYEFFKQYVSEYQFYKTTNDANIKDYYTFYKYAGQYLVASTPFVNDYSMRTPGTANNRFFGTSVDNIVQSTIRDTTPEFSISFWLKTTSTAQNTIVGIWNQTTPFDPAFILTVGYGQAGAVGVYAQSEVDDAVNAYMKSSVKSVNDGAWHHVVWTFDYNGTGTGLNPATTSITLLYVDGILYNNSSDFQFRNIGTSKRIRNTATASRVPFSIGGVGIQGWYNGNTDEVSVWNKVLSQAEVTQLYNSGTPIALDGLSYYTNCVAWYRMGDGSDNWDGTKWNLINEVGGANTDLISNGLTQSARQTDVP